MELDWKIICFYLVLKSTFISQQPTSAISRIFSIFGEPKLYRCIETKIFKSPTFHDATSTLIGQLDATKFDANCELTSYSLGFLFTRNLANEEPKISQFLHF